MASARLVSYDSIQFASLGGYEKAISDLNKMQPRKGFVWREYSPASLEHVGIERRYFTEANAQRIDGIREAIRAWAKDEIISSTEEQFLIADLLGAANRVANTAGTYGCFLSTWQRQSLDRLELLPRLVPAGRGRVSASVGDAKAIRCSPRDTVYLDPPYTKRQYAAYYHILETIALGDEPKVEGVCGIRPWQHIASDYCYRRRAVRALVDLVAALPAHRILLSYSTEGHAPLGELEAALSPLGRVQVQPLMNVGRYRPNQAASQAASAVGEVLFVVDQRAQSLGLAA
jgi:adenine-specific DNA-methyltransferase